MFYSVHIYSGIAEYEYLQQPKEQKIDMEKWKQERGEAKSICNKGPCGELPGQLISLPFYFALAADYLEPRNLWGGQYEIKEKRKPS